MKERKFEVGEMYESCGKLYKITKRTEKSVWVIRNKYENPKRKSIRHDQQGNEQADVELGWRSVTAGKFGDALVTERLKKESGL